MPYEIVADFRPSTSASPEDRAFSLLVRGSEKRPGIVARIMQVEPRLRFRIRNMLRAGNQTPLDSRDVPKVLRPKLEIPKSGSFWVRKLYCHTCLDPAGKPRWVPHIRRRLHEKHDLREGDIMSKGLAAPWQPNRSVYFGTPARILEQPRLMYSIAVTTLPSSDEEAVRFESLDAVMLLPFTSLSSSKPVDGPRLTVRPGSVERIEQLPVKPEAAVEVIVRTLVELDPNALDGQRDGKDANVVELKEQIAREGAMQEIVASGLGGIKRSFGVGGGR